jgi:hypothetical protein
VSTETAVFRVATLAVALHVVDDSFLQPEPGTSAGDHLAGGLVPVAILALAAWAYPRLRAGARAAIAITLGVLAVVGGIGESVYYTVRVGPSGDDFTGLLNPKYYAAAGEPKSIWKITEGRHTGGIDAVPEEYERRVIGFFDDALLPER